MSATAQLLKLASTAGPTRAAKVITGLLRMHGRYFLSGRGRGLAKMLPLSTPMKIHVDPASGCNFRCFFCPQTDPSALRAAGVKAGIMKLPLLQKLVDDLAGFPSKVDELVFGNYGEPLLNKHIDEMVAYAVKSGAVREVSLITNAALLTKERADKLAAAGLQKVRFSVEALSDEGYLTTTKVKVAFADIVENIRHLHSLRKRPFIYVKIIDTGLSQEEKRKFFKTFIPISDAISIENLMAVTEEAAEIVGDIAASGDVVEHQGEEPGAREGNELGDDHPAHCDLLFPRAPAHGTTFIAQTPTRAENHRSERPSCHPTTGYDPSTLARGGARRADDPPEDP